MKIGLFTDTYLPDVNGVVSSVVLLKKELEKQGNEVWVITNYSGLVEIKIDYEERIIRLPGLELKQFYGYKMTQPLHLLFIEEIGKMNFDIIHAQQEFGVGIFAGICAKKLKLPLVRTYHTAYGDYTSYFLPIYNKTVDNVAKKAIGDISKMYGEDCIRMIAPSSKTKKMLEGYGITTPISVIPTGLELERFRKENIDLNKVQKLKDELGIKEDEHVFIYVGRIAGEKSIDMIINGFKKVKDNKINAKLLIIGGGPTLEELERLMKSSGLEDYIKFLGKKPNTDIPLYYSLGEAFISASITETQGMTYIEAMANGLPLICRKDDVLEDVLFEGKNGFYFEDEESCGDAIIGFCNLDRNQVEDLSKFSINVSNLYDSQLFGRKVFSLYQEVIDEFNSGFEVSGIKLTGDVIKVSLKSQETTDIVYVSTDTYLDLGLRKNTKLTKPEYDRLKKEEKLVLGYRGALKKLAAKDCSIRQIKDVLYSKYDLRNTDVELIVKTLIEKNLLDDEKYTFNKITSYKANLYSKNKMIRKLKEAGISEDIIDKYLKSNTDEELISAKKKAERYNLLVRNKSLNTRKLTIIKKLVVEGFDYETAKKAVDHLNLKKNLAEETDILKREANKLKNKYARKYEGRELRNHIFNGLVSKGFEYDDIYACIGELEEEL